MRPHHFKVLLIVYLTLLSQSLKMASSKPKNVAIFSDICLYYKAALD